MKEAVLKIIRVRIDSLKEYSKSLSLRTSKGVVEFQIKEAEAIFRLISALPEQVYTREQVIDSIENAFRAGRTLEETDGNSSDLAATTKYILSSLTPVAVEAERTERWADEALSDSVFKRYGFGHVTATDVFEYFAMPYYVKNGVILFYNASDPGKYLIGYAEMRGGKYFATASRWITRLVDLKAFYMAVIGSVLSESKDSLAPQVNNDKTK